ncbi:MAG TPA: glycoside hydrolase family 71/99-like protein [Anaerolineae bacterium]|nr:glycoside hydrolase family 71/99-like protein [Anaerolineae bacterium]HQK14123.1 glycoside hydrolase family 71/99-like protein [Anaerolineae bacterium]
MAHILRTWGIVFAVLLLTGCAGTPTPTTTPAPATKTPTPPTATPLPSPTATATPTAVIAVQRPLLMAHYMPWYQTPNISGYWGWHWTMNHFDPAQKDAQGRPQIASHYMPLTGPYDSADPAVLEYQVLLMKLSGIDGVIVDWYGIEEFWDYGVLNRATGKLFEMIKNAGLQFAICYEDQTVKHMVDNKHLPMADVYTHGQAVMRYLQDTWFGDVAYLKADGRPVLLTFGPQYYKNATDWEKLFAGVETKPIFITLDKRLGTVATSSFPWPPMWASKDGVLTQAALESYLNSFYEKTAGDAYRVGGAFPGFHDIYKEAGVGEGYGYLDARDGETFRFTLDLALRHNPHVIQLITWNDYGEGTIIEPTEEFGYRYLEMVQAARRTMAGEDETFTFIPEDLRLPLRLFTLRKAYAGDVAVNARLDEAAAALLAGDVKRAAAIFADYP